DAARASTTGVGIRTRRWRERERGDDLPQQQPAADASLDEHGVLADRAQAGPLRVLALQDRRGINARAERFSRKLARQFAAELRQPLAHHLVIVLPPRVSRHATAGIRCGLVDLWTCGLVQPGVPV